MFLDTPHMLKLARNTMAEHGIILPDYDHPAEWAHLEALVAWEEKNGWRAGSRLSRKHIEHSKQKMRVHLAAQIFSKSTADALDYLQIDLNLPEFQNTAGTVALCRMMNDLFDLLNSRSPLAKGNKSPWTLSNLQEKSEKLMAIIERMKTWRLNSKKKQLISQSQRKTFVLGFNTTSKSTIGLANRMLNEYWRAYFYPYYTQQDFLEHLFSRVRQKCGSTDNPDCV